MDSLLDLDILAVFLVETRKDLYLITRGPSVLPFFTQEEDFFIIQTVINHVRKISYSNQPYPNKPGSGQAVPCP